MSSLLFEHFIQEEIKAGGDHMIGPGMSGSKPRVLPSLEANSKSSKKCQTLHADSVIECDLGRWRGKREGHRRERGVLGLPTLPQSTWELRMVVKWEHPKEGTAPPPPHDSPRTKVSPSGLRTTSLPGPPVIFCCCCSSFAKLCPIFATP